MKTYAASSGNVKIEVGALMKSFGLWYQEISKETKKGNKCNECCKLSLQNIGKEQAENEISEEKREEMLQMKAEDPQFSLHVNFWSLEDVKTKENIKTPILDIGIKIKNYTKLENLTFFCPFELDGELIDLSKKLESKNNASIIFNSDCEIQTKDSYTIVEIPEHDERLLVFPMEQVIMDVYYIEEVPEKHPEGTQIIFNFGNFREYVKGVERLKDLDTIYIRFRIKDASLKQHIYLDSEPINKSFESAFSGTRIIDFKVNEKRNIAEAVRAENIVNNQNWVKFKDIHYLIMVPSSYDLTSFYKKSMTCRELEDKLWDDYLETTLDISNSHVLAYHWKDIAEDGKMCEDFACLVKVNYSRAKKSTIALYMLSVVALGVLSSLIVTSLAEYFGALGFLYFVLGLGIVIVSFLIIIFAGKNS